MSDKGAFDLLSDGLVKRLRDASAEYPEGERFEVTPDEYRIDIRRDGAYVYIYMGAVNPQRDRSASSHHNFEVEFYIDAVTRLSGRKEGEERTRAGEVAASRCRYLLQQVLDSLRFGQRETYGLPDGSIGKREIRRIDPATPDGQQTENVIVAYRMTLSFTVGYDPSKDEGVALEQIRFDAERWKAWFDYASS